MLTSDEFDSARSCRAVGHGFRTWTAVCVCLALAACGDDDVDRSAVPASRVTHSNAGAMAHANEGDGGMSPTSAGDVGDRRVPFTPLNDRAFVDFFIAHHQMAITMAEHERTHGEDAQVKAVAQRVIDAQQPEIDLMVAVATELTSPASSAMPSDPHSDADMDHMSHLQGHELDGMFLTEMIAHHAAGLPVAHRALGADFGRRDQLFRDDVISASAGS